MTSKDKSIERREHRRFYAQDGAFAVLGPSTVLGAIVDISRGGLGIHYESREDSPHGSFLLDILFTYHVPSFYVEGVPVRTVWEENKGDEFSGNSVPIGSGGVKFGDLTSNQASQLEFFMRHYTVGEVEERNVGRC